ncbi:MAG: lipopolysaccharide heptosyltransferase II [Chloroflexota bacterium]
MKQNAWMAAKKILCIRLDTLGDVLMTTPAIRAIKNTLPQSHVALLTASQGAEVAHLVPEVDETLAYDTPWMKATPPRENSRPELDLVAQLREMGFDAAVIFNVYSQSALPAAFLCYLADIPLRLAHCRENPYQLLTDWVPERDPDPNTVVRHEVRRQLDLVASVGYTTQDETLSLPVNGTARYRVKKILAAAGVRDGDPWLVLHAGATAASRRYPAEHYAAAARTLAMEHGFHIVLTGTEPERETVEFVRMNMNAPSTSLVGRLDLSELTALISLAPILISNNTGPMHIAAAVGTPVVALYALTNPQHTPWQVPSLVLFHDVPCRYCYRSTCAEGHHNCLRLVPPGDVVDAALSLRTYKMLPEKQGAMHFAG